MCSASWLPFAERRCAGRVRRRPPEQVSAAFSRDLEPERPDAVSPLEREKRISELSVSLLALERTEEALILRAAGEGIELSRRGDASPVAVLGVVVVNANARTQASAA